MLFGSLRVGTSGGCTINHSHADALRMLFGSLRVGTSGGCTINHSHADALRMLFGSLRASGGCTSNHCHADALRMLFGWVYSKPLRAFGWVYFKPQSGMPFECVSAIPKQETKARNPKNQTHSHPPAQSKKSNSFPSSCTIPKIKLIPILLHNPKARNQSKKPKQETKAANYQPDFSFPSSCTIPKQETKARNQSNKLSNRISHSHPPAQRSF